MLDIILYEYLQYSLIIDGDNNIGMPTALALKLTIYMQKTVIYFIEHHYVVVNATRKALKICILTQRNLTKIQIMWDYAIHT